MGLSVFLQPIAYSLQPKMIDDSLIPDEHWMRLALDQAYRAYEAREVPVGAVIVQNGQIVAEAYNQRETLNDPTAHAEMIALTQAAESLGSWRLLNSTLYVTLEPCPMWREPSCKPAFPAWSMEPQTPKPGPAIRCTRSPAIRA